MNKLSPPKGHLVVETQDGSITFFSETFQEACHSTSGAKEETLLHYIQGCEVLKKVQENSLTNIFEVGFGLGVGFLTTKEIIPPDKKFHFISVEMDKNLLEWFIGQHPEYKFRWKGNVLYAHQENFELTILWGDARVTLEQFLKDTPLKFHAIYQDAFSPKKNPGLWTLEWFELLKQHSHEDVTLSTYSASNSIRKSLHEAGWGVWNGEKFGPKRSSTRAYLNRTTHPDVLLQLTRSPVESIKDKDLHE